jgi:uncharacterized protein (TIGR00369 family)
MSEGTITVEALQERISRAPYHQWLGLKVLSVAPDTVEVRATWREEWVANAERRHTHGGILAALVDLAADWALVARLGRAAPTIDMRVDYHRAAAPGDLVATGRVLKFGSQFSVCEAQVLDAQGRLIASGRGTYFTGPLDPPNA